MATATAKSPQSCNLSTYLAEGVLQSYSGNMQRQTHVLKKWVDVQIRIVSGSEWNVIGVTDNSPEVLFSIPQDHKEIVAEFLVDDPSSKDFLAVIVKNIKDDKKLEIFRATNLPQQRWLMASFGAFGRGLFSPKLGIDSSKRIAEWRGCIDITHAIPRNLPRVEHIYANTSNSYHLQATPQYGSYIEWLSKMSISIPCLLQIPLPPIGPIGLYSMQSGSIVTNRLSHDNFLPPLGSPNYSLISIGYGPEVELQEGSQELLDPLTKCRLFYYHEIQQVVMEDPRPPKPALLRIEVQQVVYGPDIRNIAIAQVDTTPSVSQYYTNRALLLEDKWATHLVACGIDGANGLGGANGYKGRDGNNGFQGGTGSSGGPGHAGGIGGPGGEASNGMHGTHGSFLNLTLNGDSNTLFASGSTTFNSYLGGESSESVVYIDVSGGRGGHGGNGGVAGEGGEGGHGGHGGRGRDGHAGHNGSSGGSGGSGGPGGTGGTGGKGGNGGNSGYGGACVINVSDPKLLQLVEINCSAGLRGKFGEGGAGGIGGHGGHGGTGGSGGSGGHGGHGHHGHHGQHSHHGHPGPSGFPGPQGIEGVRGAQGPNGRDGVRGTDGGLMFYILDESQSNIIEFSSWRYEITIDPTTLYITSAVDDGIFEPNEQICIRSVKLTNSGGLTLPEGAFLSMTSSPTINFPQSKFFLPKLAPKESLQVNQEFYGRIYDLPPPNTPGPFVGEAFFETRADLLGRPFDAAKTAHKLIVQYPIKIKNVFIPENLGRGEQCSLNITLANISSLPYGNFENSGGYVSVVVHFDRRLTPIANSIATADDLWSISYDVTKPDSLMIEINKINPMEDLLIPLNIALSNHAELFDRCAIQFDVSLRGKLIEYQQFFIRVAPYYFSDQQPGDMLLISDKSLTRKNFILWQLLFEQLDVRVDIWDRDRYGGLSFLHNTQTRHAPTWVGRHSGSLILFPNANLDFLLCSDVVDHFSKENKLKAVDKESSVIIILSNGSLEHNSYLIQSYIYQLCCLGEKSTFSGKDYGGKHLITPDDGDFTEKQKEIIRELEEIDTMYRKYVMSAEHNPDRQGLLSFTYGTLTTTSFPISKNSKFVINAKSIYEFSNDDEQMSVGQSEVPLGSNWAQTLIHVLYGLPAIFKMRILQGATEEATHIKFVSVSGYVLYLIDLAEMIITEEIINEISVFSENMPKLAAFVSTVLDNMQNFSKNAKNVFRIICAIQNYAENSIPKSKKSVKTSVINYCETVQKKMFEFGDKVFKQMFSAEENFASDNRRIYFKHLVEGNALFEPHLRNCNIENNQFLLKNFSMGDIPPK